MLDWQEFIASLTNSLAWPIAAIVIALIARRPVLGLIDRINEMSALGMSAKFDAKLAKATEQMVTKQQGMPLAGSGVPMELVVLAERSPRAAILEAWVRLEKALRDKVSASGLVSESDAKASIGRLLEAARRHNIIDGSLHDGLNGLRVLRNLAAHGRTEELSFEKAQEFLVLADALEMALKRPKLAQ